MMSKKKKKFHNLVKINQNFTKIFIELGGANSILPGDWSELELWRRARQPQKFVYGLNS